MRIKVAFWSNPPQNRRWLSTHSRVPEGGSVDGPQEDCLYGIIENMISNENGNIPSKENDTDSESRPWPLIAAVFLIGAASVVFASLSSIAIAVWLALLTVELYRGRTWVRSFILLSAVPILGLTAIICALGSIRFAIASLPFLVSAILLHLPPSRKWFANATAKENATHVSLRRKVVRLSYRAIIATPIAVLLPGMVFFMPSIPGIIKFSRLSGYQTKNELISAEPHEVKKTVEFIQDGTNFTAVILSPTGFLPSGPPIIIYDADGRRIDFTRDSGDNLQFLKRWKSLKKNNNPTPTILRN